MLHFAGRVSPVVNTDTDAFFLQRFRCFAKFTAPLHSPFGLKAVGIAMRRGISLYYVEKGQRRVR
jgi:hypothetical protein